MNYIISIFTGALLAIMLSFNGILSEGLGNYAATVIIHGAGLIGIIVVLIITKSQFKGLKGIPLYLYSAGLIGIITVLFNNLTFGPLGASLTIALSLLGQSVTSIIIDHFGLLGASVNQFNKKKITGLCIITAGILFMTFY